METAEYNYEDFAKPRAGDEKLAIRFFTKARQDGEESLKQGRPVFVEQDYIQIMIPGDRNNIVVRPVTQQDLERFSKQYEHWKKHNENVALSGTPLESWGVLNMAQIEEFRYFGVRSIEHMADLRDDICQKIVGSITLKQKAQVFLQVLKDEAPMKMLNAELGKRDLEIDTLKKALADQGEQIKKLLLKK